MRRVKSLFHIFIISLFLFNGFSSCALFENDVADFMEKYTETAAIEQHTFSIETYTDAANQLCIPSDQDVEITFYMRNPKQFNLIPSVNFENLDGQISRSAVGIEQTEFAIINLTLPQDFLIPADEGKDITPLINLYEPMSGRDFDRYSVSLSCNSKPPAILNPTILNKGNQTFVVAFDMPNEEEVAIRHKDLASVEINGVSYPVQVTTETDSTSDPEHPNLQVARYTFTDAHFKRSYSSSYITLKGKTFEHKANNSVYFETDDAFTNGDKEYSIILRDSAGLTSEVKASTSISKLVKPEILDRDGAPIPEGVIAAAPYDEDTEKGVITIIPPAEDHLGNPVSGTTVYYKVYEATGSGRIYTSGTTTTAKTIELPQNTYRVEAYATLTNYENSATNTVKFRFMNSVIYVEAVTSPSASNASNLTTGDGSIAAPFPTIADVIADINRNRTGNDRKPKYTIYIKGDFTSPTYSKEDPSTPQDYGSIVLDSIETDELIFKKWQGASEAKLKSINIAATSTLQKVTLGDISISGSSGSGITQNSPATLTIDGTEVTGFTSTGDSGISIYNGNTIIKNANIHDNFTGIDVTLTSSTNNFTIENGTISSNRFGLASSSLLGTCTIAGGTFTQNTEAGVYLYSGNCIITGGTISENTGKGIHLLSSSTLKLYGGTVSHNTDGGIIVSTGCNLYIKNKPVVINNTAGSPAAATNISLPADTPITVDGALTSGARMGITTVSTNEPTTIGQTYPFASGYVNSGSPSQFFTSDKGFSIVRGSGGAVSIAKSGSSGGQYLATDYNFTFAASSNGAIPGQTKAMTITPTITRTESGSTPATNITYASIADDVTWSVLVKNGGTQVASFISNSFTFPAVPEGSYKLLVTATYLGQPHGAEFDIAVNNSAENVAAYISSLTTAGTYPVIVEGPVGPDADEGLALVATAIGNLGSTSNIYIEIDATNVTPTDEATAYNGGQYFYGKTQLKKILLPDWMLGIIQNMFFNCWNLEEVLIPDTVVYIAQGAFKNCSRLTTVNLPAGLTEIDNNAFAGCTNLTTINFAGTKNEWGAISRGTNWHTSIPATTQVHCTDGNCELDYVYIPVSFTGTSYTVNGDGTVLFGDWPQTVLPSSSSVTVDESISVTQGTFTYYYGSDGNWYAKNAENANGLEEQYKYSDGTQPVQNGSVYRYFKVEPIEWKILTTDYNGTGKKLLLAKKCLLPLRFDGSSNDYANSEIRTYLNDGFYNSAFTTELQARIADTTVVNNARSTNPDLHATQWDSGNNPYASDTPTTDKLFLLSEQEVTKSEYGFADYNVNGADSTRLRFPTDFAKAAGAYMGSGTGGGNRWWLRSPYYMYDSMEWIVRENGSPSTSDGVTTGTYGLVPALCLTE